MCIDLNAGIWSPSGTPQPTRREIKPVAADQSTSPSQSQQAPTPPPPPIWKPRSADPSPVLERKDYRPVPFQSPQLARKNPNSQRPNWSQSTSSLNSRSKGAFQFVPLSKRATGKYFKSFSTFFRPCRREIGESCTTCQRVLFESTTIILSSRRSANKWRRCVNQIAVENNRVAVNPFNSISCLFAVHSHTEHIIQRQNTENERQRKMADLANRRHDGGIPSDVTLRSVSSWHLSINLWILDSVNLPEISPASARRIRKIQFHYRIHNVISKAMAQRAIKLNAMCAECQHHGAKQLIQYSLSKRFN